MYIFFAKIDFKASFICLTASALFANKAFLHHLTQYQNFFDTIFTNIQGTPYKYHFDHILLQQKTEQAIIFFWSFKILSTKKQLSSGIRLMFQETCGVPPTIVSAATFQFLIEIEKLEFHYKTNLVKGIIVVSPCPPITILKYHYGFIKIIRSKTRTIKAPPIPIILFFGNPVDFNAKYVIVSIGLKYNYYVSGEN
jgi:hypothetical protein